MKNTYFFWLCHYLYQIQINQQGGLSRGVLHDLCLVIWKF